MQCIPASMAFMVQAACIVFTALASVVVLHRRLNHLHIEGIFAALVGVAIVTVAGLIYADDERGRHEQQLSALAGGDDASNGAASHDSLGSVAASGHSGWLEALLAGIYAKRRLFAGVSLTLTAQCAQAMQFVIEEKLLGESELHPVQVMGLEGILSTLFSVLAVGAANVIPVAGQPLENWPDTWGQLANSAALRYVMLFNFLGVAGTNYFGLRVSGVAPLRFHRI
jgi:drug/metabolite transporter (DMT)-like permease